MKKLFIILVGLMLMTLDQNPVCAAPDAKAGRYGGTLVWGTYTKPTPINPLFTTQGISTALEDLIFNKLVRINAKGEIEPDLAESWDISADGCVYTFHLRRGVRFHDGVECTAYDVKFTYDALMNRSMGSPFRASYDLILQTRVIDTHTFQVVLSKPLVPFLYRMTREIVPRHLLEGIDIKSAPFNRHPVGSGPFKFKEWTADNRIILEENADYYEGRPFLDTIIAKSYDTATDLWCGLMRGEADLVEFLDQEDYEIVKKDNTFKAYAIPGDWYYALSYNLGDSVMADKRVRQAIAYAINRRELIQRVAGGYGVECNGPFYPGSIGVNPEVKPFDYAPQKAKDLLAEAGWKDNNNDGILEKNQQDLEIRVLVDTRSLINQKMIMFIRQQLLEVGIRINVIAYKDNRELTHTFFDTYKPQAQLRMISTGVESDEPSAAWSSRDFELGCRLWEDKDEEISRLFEAGRTEQNRSRRRGIYQRIHALIYNGQCVCFLFLPDFFCAVSSFWENTAAFFTVNMPTYTIKDWYVNRTKETNGGERR